jgi:hypothetical protein
MDPDQWKAACAVHRIPRGVSNNPKWEQRSAPNRPVRLINPSGISENGDPEPLVEMMANVAHLHSSQQMPYATSVGAPEISP